MKLNLTRVKDALVQLNILSRIFHSLLDKFDTNHPLCILTKTESNRASPATYIEENS